MPVFVSCGAIAGGAYRIDGPGRGPGPEYSDAPSAPGAVTAANAAAQTSATAVTKRLPLLTRRTLQDVFALCLSYVTANRLAMSYG